MEKLKNYKPEALTDNLTEDNFNKIDKVEENGCFSEIVNLETELGELEVMSFDAEISRDVTLETLKNIKDLLENQSEDGFNNILIAYRGVEELEGSLPENSGIDLSSLKKILASEITKKEGFNIGEMEDVDLRLEKLKKILEDNFNKESRALISAEEAQQDKKYIEYKKLEKEIKTKQALLVKGLNNFYKSLSRKIENYFLSIGEKFDDKALDSKLFQVLGAKNIFSKAAKLGAVSLIALSCISRVAEAGDFNEIVDEENENDDQGMKMYSEKDKASMLANFEKTDFNFHLFQTEAEFALVLDICLEDFGGLMVKKSIPIENKMELIDIVISSGVLISDLFDEIVARSGEIAINDLTAIITKINGLESDLTKAYLFEESNFLGNLKNERPEDLKKLLIDLFSEMSSLDISGLYFKILNDFPEIKEDVKIIFSEKIETESFRLETIEDKLDLLQILSYYHTPGNKRAVSFKGIVKANILMLGSPVDIFSNIKRVNKLSPDIRDEIINESIKKVEDEKDYMEILNNEELLSEFFGNIDNEIGITFIKKVSELDPWFFTDFLENDSGEVFEKFIEKNRDELQYLCDKARNKIEISEGNYLFISEKISLSDFPIRKEWLEGSIAGEMHMGRSETRANDVNYDLISIPFDDFNEIIYSSTFQEILRSKVSRNDITWMNAVSVVHAVFRKIEQDDLDLNDINIKKISELIFEQREKISEHELLGSNNYLMLIADDDWGMLNDAPRIEQLFKECGGKEEDILLNNSKFRRLSKEKILEGIRSASELEDVRNGKKTVTLILNSHGLEAGLGYSLYDDEFINYEELAEAIHDTGCVKSFNLLVDSCYGYDSVDNFNKYLESEGTDEKPFVEITAANKNLESFSEDSYSDQFRGYFFRGIASKLQSKNGKNKALKVKDIYSIEGDIAFVQDLSIRTGGQNQYEENWEKKEFFGIDQIKKIREERSERSFYDRFEDLETPPKFSLEIGKYSDEKQESQVSKTV